MCTEHDVALLIDPFSRAPARKSERARRGERVRGDEKAQTAGPRRLRSRGGDQFLRNALARVFSDSCSVRTAVQVTIRNSDARCHKLHLADLKLR